MKRIIALLISSSLAALILSGCSGNLTTSSTSGSTYRLDAILVKDMLTENARIDVSLEKNGSTYTGADSVKLSTFKLLKGTSSYYRDLAADLILPAHTYTLSIYDANLYYSAAITVPGAFTFSVTAPANHQPYVSGAVSVEWSVSAYANGYILATVPPSGALASSSYITGQSASIPATYFQYSGSPTTDSVFHIYMGAYWGAPISSTAIPFNMPIASVPADNVSVTSLSLTGRIASIVIPVYDSVFVPLP